MEKCREGTTLVDTAMHEIIQLILKQKMREGDRLPNEYELAQRLGVGRSTLREATRRLVTRNILEVRQGAGTFVSSKRGVPEDPLGLVFMGSDPQLALDLLDIRLMLEPEICASAARKMSGAALERLRICSEEVGSLINSGQDYGAADAHFHRCLAECSGNRVLPNLISIFHASVETLAPPGWDRYRWEIHSQHSRILDAVSRGDAAGARYNMYFHLNTTRDALAKNTGRVTETARAWERRVLGTPARF